MKHYLQSEKEVISALETTENGLTSAEAERRLAENGRNRLAEGKKVGIVKRFFMQLADPMIIILIVAAVISAVIAVIEKETPTDVFIIMFVVILNAVLGVIQESKAEKAIEAEYPQLITEDSPTKHVGGYALNTFEKVTHAVQMGSLQDVFSKAEICSFADKTSLHSTA